MEPERPLLFLERPRHRTQREKRGGGGGRPPGPGRQRQRERLGPRFAALRRAFESGAARLQENPVGLVPEKVIVFETAAPMDVFLRAARAIGLEWLEEVECDDVEPDDDFYATNIRGERRDDKPVPRRLFLTFSNQRALEELLSLWNRWSSGEELPRGYKSWRRIFELLRDVRLWGLQDRLLETGALENWRFRMEHDDGQPLPCEIELWNRGDHDRQAAARDSVRGLLQDQGARVVAQATIEEIGYDALLTQLPASLVEELLGDLPEHVALVQCDDIQFIRPVTQMTDRVATPQEALAARDDDRPRPERGPVGTGDAVVALFDGLPLQNHQELAGRLIVDDPDDLESVYQAGERLHGTAMASLILHGDLGERGNALPRPLYVRPVLCPSSTAPSRPRPESFPEDQLIVDLIHRAVVRLFDESEGAVAPQTRVINLSIGSHMRPFEGALSPLACLLDWLSWEYKVLFVISAGNHTDAIRFDVSAAELAELSPEERAIATIRAMAADGRNRRLPMPAESINSLTIAATHEDSSDPRGAPNLIDPLRPGLPSHINAHGPGHRRGLKPDLLAPGGQTFLRRPVVPSSNELGTYVGTLPPGQVVATPGTSGRLNETTWQGGTSNAAALTSRAACFLDQVLDALREEPGGEVVDQIPRAIWLKTMLVHSADWGDAKELFETALKTAGNSKTFRDYVSRFLGFGRFDPESLHSCTAHRVTALGGGTLREDQAHEHSFPLPPSLSGVKGHRRLRITLGYFTPINAGHQSWRRAHLWFSPPTEELEVKRSQTDWQGVQRGTVQHEILDGDRAAEFGDDSQLEVVVSCRADAGPLETPVDYALAVSLEVAPSLGVAIYDEVRARITTRVRVRP